MGYYRAFGLQIESELTLPPGIETAPKQGPTDLRIRFEPPGRVKGAEDSSLLWEGLCRLTLEEQTLWVAPLRPAVSEEPALAVAGSGLALALHRRGCIVLHGACVRVFERGVCLLGPSGSGKSTLAAALQAAGHLLISDAMTVLDGGEGRAPTARPGWPVLKLWPTSVVHLGFEGQVAGPVHRESEKQLCRAPGRVAEAPTPVDAFLVVGPGGPPHIEPVSPGEGLLGLLRNHFLVDHLTLPEQAELLKRIAAILQDSEVAVLRRGATLHELSGAVSAIESWLQRPRH